MIVARGRLIGVALWAVVAAPVLAQEATNEKRPVAGVVVDFQDTDLRVVLTALAEAAGINVALGDLPSRRVTLRLRDPVPKSEVREMLKSLASTYDISVVDEARLLKFSASTLNSGRPVLGLSSGDQQLSIYRLRHARAAVLAPTLQSMFNSRGAVGAALAAPSAAMPVPLSQRLREGLVAPFAAESSDRPAPRPAQGGVAGGIPGQLHAEVQIIPDDATNALIVRAVPADWVIVRQVIEAMDLRPLEVLIEVVIAEVRESRDLEVGIAVATEGTPSTGKLQGTLGGSSVSDFAVKLSRSAGTFELDAALTALASRGHVRIVSRPLLLAQNNQEAHILVGSQRPFVQVARSLPTDAGVRDQVVQYRDVGTSLSIVPTINADGYVNLQVVQEVSSATAETQFGAPIISTREVTTRLLVKNGQTGVIGGLVDRQTDNTRSGIPILSALPGIGGLFGSTSRRTTTSELFVFLTPYVIVRDEDMDELREAIRQSSGPGGGFGEVPLQFAKPSSPAKP